jgi:CO dehydrogenase nickel-insertion accessory protein CooC1
LEPSQIGFDKILLIFPSENLDKKGCYCYINSVLKNVNDTYDMTLLDSPAGLEHFTPKTGLVERLVDNKDSFSL